jgi:hypothetical protein
LFLAYFLAYIRSRDLSLILDDKLILPIKIILLLMYFLYIPKKSSKILLKVIKRAGISLSSLFVSILLTYK